MIPDMRTATAETELTHENIVLPPVRTFTAAHDAALAAVDALRAAAPSEVSHVRMILRAAIVRAEGMFFADRSIDLSWLTDLATMRRDEKDPTQWEVAREATVDYPTATIAAVTEAFEVVRTGPAADYSHGAFDFRIGKPFTRTYQGESVNLTPITFAGDPRLMAAVLEVAGVL